MFGGTVRVACLCVSPDSRRHQQERRGVLECAHAQSECVSSVRFVAHRRRHQARIVCAHPKCRNMQIRRLETARASWRAYSYVVCVCVCDVGRTPSESVCVVEVTFVCNTINTTMRRQHETRDRVDIHMCMCGYFYRYGMVRS